MSNLRFNITLIIVLIVFALAGLGINYIASGIGLPDGIADSVGYIVLLGLLVLYIVYRQKEGKEINELQEKVARLEERNKKTDYYQEEYKYYYNRYWELMRERDADHGKET